MIALLFLALTALAGSVLIPADAIDADEARRLFWGRRIALLVGPESFDDSGFVDLRFADDDARDLGQALADRGHFDKVWTLTEDATRGAVDQAMADVAAAATGPDDTVFIYFSTHGTLGKDAAGQIGQFVVLADTRLADVSGTALSHDTLLTWLDSLPSRKKVLVLATCHSGQGKSALPRDLAAELASTKGVPLTPLRDVSEAVVLIGVCAWNETAREAEGLGHDIYTWYLLEALELGDVDNDGAVTITEAHDHARQRTYAFTGGAQRPYARAEVLGGDPIVLVGEPGRSSVAAVGSYRERLDGYRIRVDGQIKGVLPGLVTIDPGQHRVELLAPGEDRVIAAQRVRLNAGTRTEVATLIRRDTVRLGSGGGWHALSVGGTGGPTVSEKLHLPRLLGKGWELIGQGSTVLRWPRPTVDGSLLAEHAIVPGTWQLRSGIGLQGFLLNAPGEPHFLEPSLAPVGSLSLAWLPNFPVFLRISATAAPVWYTDGGKAHFGASGRVFFALGGAL